VPATADATSLTWTVSFNRPVTGVEASDFALGAAAGSWSVTGVTGSGAGPYTVTASGSGAGTEILTLAAGSVTDLAGTTGPIAARSAASVPVVTSAAGPTSTDAPRVGMAQTGTAGTWVGEGTATTYQWQVSDDGLGGWTSATGTGNATLTYTPAQADLWKYLRLTVTGANAAGTGTASSAAAYVAMPDLLFASNNVGNSVTTMSVGASGALTPGTTTSGFTAPRRVAATPDGRFLYVPNAAATGTVSQFAVSETGVLTALSPATVSSGASPTGVWVTPNGRYAYVTNNGGATVSQYSIGADGRLTALSPATVAAGTAAAFMAINATGTRAYVVNRNAGATPATISQYSIGGDGKLTPLTAATVSVPNLDPVEMALTPDGRYAYVTSFNTGKVTQYSVGADGALTVLSPSSVSVTSAVGIAVSPDSGSLYVGSWNAASTTSGVYQFTIGANGQLAAKTPAALPSASRYARPAGSSAGSAPNTNGSSPSPCAATSGVRA
jgi:6-phosphogluconolactonase (cycloisomerase 2 family)